MNEQFKKLISIFQKSEEDMHDENFIRIEDCNFEQCLKAIEFITPNVNKIISSCAENNDHKAYNLIINEIENYNITNKDKVICLDIKGANILEKYKKPVHFKLDIDYHVIHPFNNNYKQFRVWYGKALKGIYSMHVEIQNLYFEKNHRISFFTYYKTKNDKNKIVDRMNILDFYF